MIILGARFAKVREVRSAFAMDEPFVSCWVDERRERLQLPTDAEIGEESRAFVRSADARVNGAGEVAEGEEKLLGNVG